MRSITFCETSQKKRARQREQAILLLVPRRGAEVRPDFNWNKPPVAAMGNRKTLTGDDISHILTAAR